MRFGERGQATVELVAVVPALVLACEMLVAYFQAHFPQGAWPIQNKGELPLLFMLIWLFLAGNGPGPASLDAPRR